MFGYIAELGLKALTIILGSILFLYFVASIILFTIDVIKSWK